MTSREINLKKTLDSMEKLYSTKYGIANSMNTSDINQIRVKVESDTLQLGNIIPLYRTYVSNKVISGTGASLNKDKSKIKAFGEFIERFSADNTNNDHELKIIYDTYNNLSSKNKCLDMSDLIDYEDNAYSQSNSIIVKYNKNSIISWVKSKNLITNEEVYIPGQKAFLGIKLLNGEQRHLTWLSTGLACGSSYSSALLSGIYEVVERDSFMLTWQLKLNGKKVLIDKIQDTQLYILYNHIKTYITGNDELCIYDISRTKGIYTLVTFIRNYNSNSFGLITSAASDVSAEKALLKSLEELCLTQGYAYNKLIKDKNNQNITIKKSEVKNLDSHLFYYSDGSRSHEFNFINFGKDKIKLSEMNDYMTGSDEDKIKYILNIFENEKIPVYSVNLTRQIIKELGMYVVRAIIVGYNDIEYSHNLRQTKNKRLTSFKKLYNCKINDAPHPFP